MTAGVPNPKFARLRGGYDCANVLIPYSSADYYELRKTIAVAKPKGADATEGAVALDANVDFVRFSGRAHGAHQ